MFGHKRPLAIGLVLLACMAAESLGQTTEGSVRGYIRDEQSGAMPGVTVTAASPNVPLPYNTTSDQEGYYRLVNLPPGTYIVTAELAGFATFRRENIVVRAGLNLPLDIVMQLRGLEETVTVTAETPMLEVKKAVVAVNVSGDLQRSIPLGNRRHWSEFMRFAPGVVSRDSTTDNAPIFYIRGAGIVSYSTMVDGADITSAVNPWWGYAAIPDMSIDDVQVKTGGLDASAPLGMGAAANVVTKSGTNEFHGGFMFGYTPESWIGNNTPGATAQTMSLIQPEVAVGGPIAQDRLWFFGSYRRRGGILGISRTEEQIANLKAIDPTFEVFDNDNRANIYFAKLTGQINPNHQISGFYNRDHTVYDSNATLNVSNFTVVDIGGQAVSGRLMSAWNDSLTSQVTFSWNDKGVTGDLVNKDAPSRDVYRDVFVSGGQLVGSTQLATLGSSESRNNNPYTKWTITGDVTKYVSGLAGSHELQVGVFLQPSMHRNDSREYANQGFAREYFVLVDPNNTAGERIPFYRRIYDAGDALLADGRFSDNAFYIQDAWSPTPRLTLNLGLRVDYVTRNDDLFEMELQNSWEVGPRFGVNYMLTSDARNSVRASYMRVHDAVNINAQSASGAGSQGSGAQTIGWRDEYDMNLDGIFDTVFLTPAASPVSPNRIIDPDYHQPFVDEWAVGYRRQFSGQVSLDVGFVHRDYRDRTALVEQNGIYEGNVFTGYKNEDLNEIYLLTSNRWNHPVYKAIEVIASKRTDRLQILGSYTRVFSHMAGTWQPRDPASFIQPGAFPMDRGLLSNDNRSASSNNGYDGARGSTEWMENILRIQAVYKAPWDLIVSGSYTLQEGLWTGPIQDRIDAPDPQFGPPTVRLSNGRVVSNPLATTLRFAYPTRGEGQLVLPTAHYLNVRFGRSFSFGEQYRFEVDLDIFNILNSAANQSYQSGSNQLFSQYYGEGSNIQMPRTFQLGLQFEF